MKECLLRPALHHIAFGIVPETWPSLFQKVDFCLSTVTDVKARVVYHRETGLDYRSTRKRPSDVE